MKLHLNLAAACLNQTPLDWPGNLDRIRVCLNEARERGAHLLCLPELCLSGYSCEDAFLSTHTLDRSWQALQDLLPETRGLVVNVGLPVLHQRRIYNTAALLADGRLLGLAAKQFLAGDGLHYEPRWFHPWPADTVETWIAPDGTEIPIGDITFDVGGVRMGFEICEDAWVASRPGIRHARRGADLVLNPSASHFAFGKFEVRRRFVLEGSRAFHAAYLYANLLGNESGRVLYDGGEMIAAKGKTLAAGERFSYQDHTLSVARVDLAALRLAHAASSRAASASEENDSCLRVHPYAWPARPAPGITVPVMSEFSKEEAFTRIMTLGLFDYLRKSHSQGFVVSLSGGADSAAVVSLIHLMTARGRRELGDEAFAAKLGWTPPAETNDWMRRMLTTVYQATAQSGDVTRHAARDLAAALGAEHVEWEIEELVQGYRDRCEQALGRPLAWDSDDIAMQNIQARARAPGVWMLANLRNALLLSTSNRSEAAVGYATMDGDTCGGLCPLAGIDKAFLLHWLRWLEKEGAPGLDPLPVLHVINRQQPTAELRPAGQGQTDETDLMPYPVLDAIEKAAIRDKLGPADTLERVEAQFPGHAPRDLRLWVARFFRLWSRNQWKRERYAPGFHVDDENLDPKTWCRWPILSGGFADELPTLEIQA